MSESMVKRVSPATFDMLQRAFATIDPQGRSPEEITMMACRLAGIDPPRPFEPVEIVVDPEPSLTPAKVDEAG